MYFICCTLAKSLTILLNEHQILPVRVVVRVVRDFLKVDCNLCHHSVLLSVVGAFNNVILMTKRRAEVIYVVRYKNRQFSLFVSLIFIQHPSSRLAQLAGCPHKLT